MGSLTEGLDNLERAVETLMVNYRTLLQSYHQLQEENRELANTIQEKNLIIEKLETTNKTKELTETLYNKQTDHNNTKQIINEMMREIDHCLLLLEERGGTE